MDVKRKKILDDICTLEKQKANGAINVKLADSLIASLQTQLKEIQSIAPEKMDLQIMGDVKNGIVIVGNNNAILSTIDQRELKKELRNAYLNHLFETVSVLQLSGIDPKLSGDVEAGLKLSAVYTSLMTLSSQDQESLEKTRLDNVDHLVEFYEAGRVSAIEMLNQHSRLILLGDPGSGKSTFVNYISLCLAGEALSHSEVNLKTLTEPILAYDDNHHLNNQTSHQSWDHGALLPIRVSLRDFAVNGYLEVGEKISAKTLLDYIISELDTWALREFEHSLLQELLEKGGLLLLDGLDEVSEVGPQRTLIKQAVEGFAASFPKCRILVTSRIYAYQDQHWRLKGFCESILAPFSKNQIIKFIERWYSHIAIIRQLNADDTLNQANSLKHAIVSNKSLAGMAERPLLLTLMASLHAWRGGALPEKREELYSDAIDLLLDWWESPKKLHKISNEPTENQPSLSEWLNVDSQKLRLLLSELAFRAHFSQKELTGTADVSEVDLVSSLLYLNRNPDVNPRQLIEYLRKRTGLLILRSSGIYTFSHRTFQEYLAACYLVDHDYPDKIVELVLSDFNRWREVALLAGAKASRGMASATWSLVDALCYRDPDDNDPEKYEWGAQLAGRVLVENEICNDDLNERNIIKYERVREWLVKILETGRLPALERVRAGNTLATLGDTRFDLDRWCLPKDDMLGFIHIPAGKYIMGSAPEKDELSCREEQPQHELSLTEYWIARFPVTVAQYRVFVESTQYSFDRWQYNPHANHPIVTVTWYDAIAYCEWLTKKLYSVCRQYSISGNPFWVGLAEERLFVTLPSEAEWEKAARGINGSIYPWQGNFDFDKANTRETGIGTTSPVGAFPGGVSPFGLLDVSGNVWEWARGIWGEDFLEPISKYPYKVGTDYENLDAPIDVWRTLRGGGI